MPATRIDVMVVDKQSTRATARHRGCRNGCTKEATVQVQTRDGASTSLASEEHMPVHKMAISISSAPRSSLKPEASAEYLSKGFTGRINLSSAGGGVEVENVRPLGPDTFEVGTVSGISSLTTLATQRSWLRQERYSDYD